MQLNEALDRISEIRLQMARASVFRGYRAAMAAVTGAVSFITATAQTVLISDPVRQFDLYLVLWVGAAAGCLVMLAVEQAAHWWRDRSALAHEMTQVAVEQFLPSVVAGGLLTFVIARTAPEAVWMLPGLWQIIFSLGLFASCRFLPRELFWAAAWYLATGLGCLALLPREWSLNSWTMGIPFGVGQLLTAAVLYWTLERDHAITKVKS